MKFEKIMCVRNVVDNDIFLLFPVIRDLYHFNFSGACFLVAITGTISSLSLYCKSLEDWILIEEL